MARMDTSASPTMTQHEIVLDTIRCINTAIRQDPNSLTTTRAGDVAPERAYIELIRELLNLTNK